MRIRPRYRFLRGMHPFGNASLRAAIEAVSRTVSPLFAIF